MTSQIPDHFKTQDMCIEVVEKYSFLWADVPDHLKTQQICNEGVRTEPILLACVPDHLKHRTCAIRLCAEIRGCHFFLINM